MIFIYLLDSTYLFILHIALESNIISCTFIPNACPTGRHLHGCPCGEIAPQRSQQIVSQPFVKPSSQSKMNQGSHDGQLGDNGQQPQQPQQQGARSIQQLSQQQIQNLCHQYRIAQQVLQTKGAQSPEGQTASLRTQQIRRILAHYRNDLVNQQGQAAAQRTLSNVNSVMQMNQNRPADASAQFDAGQTGSGQNVARAAAQRFAQGQQPAPQQVQTGQPRNAQQELERYRKTYRELTVQLERYEAQANNMNLDEAERQKFKQGEQQLRQKRDQARTMELTIMQQLQANSRQTQAQREQLSTGSGAGTPNQPSIQQQMKGIATPPARSQSPPQRAGSQQPQQRVATPGQSGQQQSPVGNQQSPGVGGQAAPTGPSARPNPPASSNMAPAMISAGASMNSLPIPQNISVSQPVPVNVKPLRPTLSGGSSMASPALVGPARTRQPNFEMPGDRVLSKRKLRELVISVAGDQREAMIDGDVEELLLDLADEFVTSVTSFACRLAKHRKADTLEVKDIQLHLERNWNIRIPGYCSDEIRSVRKNVPTTTYQQKVSGVNMSRAVGGQK